MTENVGTPTALEIDPPATRGLASRSPAAVRKPYSIKVHTTLWLMVVPSDSTTWKVSCWAPEPKPASSTSPFATTPSLETNGDQRMLHFTMQNTLSFQPGQTSIYKRAAQSFDLFLAPELKDISNRVPTDAAVNALHFSVLNRVGAGKAETIEYICPMDSMRAFVENKITTQELINKSVVLVNGVRIGVDLQLVE